MLTKFKYLATDDWLLYSISIYLDLELNEWDGKKDDCWVLRVSILYYQYMVRKNNNREKKSYNLEMNHTRYSLQFHFDLWRE